MGVLVDPRHIQDTRKIGNQSFVVGMICLVGEGFGIVDVSQFFRTPRCSDREATPVLARPLPTFACSTCHRSIAPDPTPRAIAGTDRAKYHGPALHHFRHYFQSSPKGRVVPPLSTSSSTHVVVLVADDVTGCVAPKGWPQSPLQAWEFSRHCGGLPDQISKGLGHGSGPC